MKLYFTNNTYGKYLSERNWKHNTHITNDGTIHMQLTVTT